MNAYGSRIAAGLIGSLLIGFVVRPAHSEVFERDWKVPGDGLLTYDNVNGREWLDLSQTLLDQFGDPDAEFPEFPDPHYANFVAELAPGGLFEGFTQAVVGEKKR